MQVDLVKGKTETLHLANGITLTVVGGLTVRIEKDGIAIYEIPVKTDIPEGQSIVRTVKIDDKTTLTFNNGFVVDAKVEK